MGGPFIGGWVAAAGGGGWWSAGLRAADSVDSAAAAEVSAAAARARIGDGNEDERISQPARSRRISGGDRCGGAKTSGEIRVFIAARRSSRRRVAGRANRNFQELGMDKTAERNAILIFVAPRAQKFAVVGDEGVHQRCGRGVLASSWSRCDAGAFQDARNFTDALVRGDRPARADCWRRHFPCARRRSATSCPTAP